MKLIYTLCISTKPKTNINNYLNWLTDALNIYIALFIRVVINVAVNRSGKSLHTTLLI